jgi:hypothetical protein
MFFAPEHIFGSTEGVGSSFHVLRSRTRFRRCRGRRVSFSCFACPNTFSAVPRVSCPVFRFYAPGLVFGGSGGMGSHFLILFVRTRVPRYRGRPFPFSCFPHPDMFSTEPRPSGLVFKFCAPVLIFDGTEGVESRFHVLCSRTHFRRYRGPRVPFSCFARPDSFSTVLRASSPFSMFLAPGHIFGSTEGVGSHYHVLRSTTPFRWYQGRRVSFSCFRSLYTFSAVPRAPCPVFSFCAPRIVFDGIVALESHFLVLRA